MDTNGAKLTVLDYAIIALTLATAAIHFTLVFPSTLFILNALGYVGLLAGLYLPIPALAGRRDFLRWALIGYTAFTIAAWLFMSDVRTPLAYATKLIEGVLIVLLVLKGRQASA
jgi:hypothetical protein